MSAVRLHIGNIPNDAFKSELQDMFRDFADDITDLWVARTPPGFGFMCVKKDAVDRFLARFNGAECRGRPLRIEVAKNQDRVVHNRSDKGHQEDASKSDRRRGRSRDRDDSRKRRGSRDKIRDKRRRDDDEGKDSRRKREDSRDGRRKREDSRDGRRKREDSRDGRRKREDSRDGRRRRRSPSTSSSSSSAASSR